jgi:hypothetical protein
MRQGRRERVRVGVGRLEEFREALISGFRAGGKPQLEHIVTASVMGVSLSGDSFDIAPLTPDEQVVAGVAVWEFDVIPRRSGSQVLTLCVTLRIEIPQRPEGRMAIPVLDREITVQVNVVFGLRQFVGRNWQWLVATVIGLGGAVVGWEKIIH